MRESKVRFLILAAIIAGLLSLSACSLREKKEGDNKRVDIQTPVGGMHVSTEADARDVGIAVYPGATPKPGTAHDQSQANVNISTSFFGLKVAALTYLSNDSPDRVTAYYKKELAKYGAVLECQSNAGTGRVVINKGSIDDNELHCDNHKSGNTLELKTGTQTHQHVVAIKPDGKGTEFSLVYVNAHGQEDAL